MRKALLILLVMSIGSSAHSRHTINALLNDISYTERFGVMPDKKSNENLRISIHLAYVENLLRLKNIQGLSPSQLVNRTKILDILHEYWTTGVFPANYSYTDERKPCFIDPAGLICAVGYLIEQTAGRNLAEYINSQEQYSLIYEMNNDILSLILAWAIENGLTIEECAMIQPVYGPPPPTKTIQAGIDTDYGISSGILGGINIGLTAWNLSSNSKSDHQYAGLVTGSTQLLLGILNIKKNKTSYEINGGEVRTLYTANNNLSYLNIASGTSAILTSALRLARKKKNTESSENVTIYANPYKKSLYVGLSITKRI